MIKVGQKFHCSSLAKSLEDFLNNKKKLTWDKIEKEVTQCGTFSNMNKAAKALAEMQQKERSVLSSRILDLALMAYVSPDKRDNSDIQAWLAEYFTDALKDLLIREDVAIHKH